VSQRKERSIWVYLGCGCGCLVLLLAAAFGAVVYFGIRAAHSVEEGIKNPVTRAERVRDLLGYESPPAGYEPAMAITLPFVFRLAVLTDRPPAADGQDDSFERAFFYFRPSTWMARSADLRKVFEGSGNPAHAFERWESTDVRLRGSETLGEGTVTVAGREIPYVARRGEVEFERHQSEGILAVFVVKCAGKDDGLGGWLVPDTTDLTGSPADPAALTEFLSRFDLCR
jgi:hypothetical protein